MREREREREREWGSHRKWRTAIGYMKIYLLHVTRPNVDKISKKKLAQNDSTSILYIV